ncbi:MULTISPECIES: APC family permease [unclassified Leeuwenhoekiella]|uniref:APC family permease n=1 Tax=unclassified Leeuwenhoekiella TaxID=2615029 RepID=UPI000C5BB439|nr:MULTISPECIES: APC family permease [unclassified Leeuwenhoekiella]MAW95207.1 amino acid permease [Leeuwenhoekiella sp.]MBA81870.1 amino acid permease [Leeuwenhoekiella sp.]|tara:strand:+ start:26119 stop:27852 length:1734 start_codon:yes stop_codon:yes gene_type:complete
MAKKKLNQLEATAICGNDISSSCLYVSALAIVYAGQYAWISLLVVAVVLFFFRKIYGEVVGALPLNGGAYNALLNTTKKSTASLAASLTVLSYMATCVISATEAIKYVHSIWEFIPVIPVTIGLMLLFMGLVILGIGESSKVAIAIFLFHLTSLTLLCSFCIYFFFTEGFDTLVQNFNHPIKTSITTALFLGFSAAMLGISGFESSANYVEEQKKGVFPKTLRNMWIVVTIFNPLIAFLALAIIPINTVVENQDALLSYLGGLSGGSWLSLLVGIDAALVLSGAVLTSFVGVGGLMERMALDRILPSLLLKKNKKGSSYIIFILFFVLCASILLVTGGDLAQLAGIYTIAFLLVMVLFGIGNLLLKINRSALPRPERSSYLGLFIAIAAVTAAIIGNIVLNPGYLVIFFEYLIPTLLVVFFMLYRVRIYKAFLMLLDYIFPDGGKTFAKLDARVKELLKKVNAQQFVFFTKNDDIATLNRVMQYVSHNEATKRLKIVSVGDEKAIRATSLPDDIKVLDRAYPNIKIEYILEPGTFCPEKIEELSKRWKIPTNFMFIGSPSDESEFSVEELGEVRLII